MAAAMPCKRDNNRFRETNHQFKEKYENQMISLTVFKDILTDCTQRTERGPGSGLNSMSHGASKVEFLHQQVCYTKVRSLKGNMGVPSEPASRNECTPSLNLRLCKDFKCLPS